MKTVKITPLYRLLFAAACFGLFAFKPDGGPRTIKLAGLIVNAATLKPIGSAHIYDTENHLLGTSDGNGYFNVSLIYNKPGPISFKIKIKKNGFESFTDQENWGDLAGGNKTVMYFGLSDKSSVAHSFSDLATDGGGNLSYASALSGFAKVKHAHEFEQKLSSAKKGNQNTLFNIDGNLYIVDEGGWIKIDSDNDLIFINGKRTIAAKELNNIISRKNIKSMTPLENQKEKFSISTK